MTQPAADVLARARQERLALAVVFFSLRAVFASWAGRIPQLKEQLALSDGQLGVSMFALAVGSLISMLASAALGARFGTHITTIVFSIFLCLALPLIPLSGSWNHFSLFLFAFGFAMGGQDVSMNAQAIHVEREYNRPIMSSFHGTFSLGAMIGGAFSSLMCVLQIAPLLHFCAISIFFTLALTVAAKKIHAPAKASDENPSPMFVLPSKHIVVLAIVAFCSFIGEGAISDWSAVYLAHELNSGPAIAAAGFSTFCVTMTICRFTGDRLVERLGPKKILLLGGLTAAVGIAASLIFANPVMVLLSYLLVGVGFSCMVPVS
ncbi:MAG: MFS transporter, partial [Cyanobacteria bacterium]|nr:MFS transporter [Cyanobacteriota bacterium]